MTMTAAPPSATVAPTAVPPTSTSIPTLAAADPVIGSTSIGTDGMTLLFVPEGDFIMGADATEALAECQNLRSDCRLEWFTNAEPPHTVKMDAFWMDEHEVTNKQYAACVSTGKCAPPFQNNSYTRGDYYGNPRYDEYPVIYVTWQNAHDYCEWAGRRLPTEAEWEKAGRGTDERLYPWGNEKPTSNLLNFALKVGDTSPIKSYSKGVSPYGVYDMSGNVWEWVNDWYDENYYRTSPASNPPGPAEGTDRVTRSSAWIFYDFDVRVTDRYGNDPKTANNVIGFRCARSR
jgi:formylglycine-generating enzyme required for sulfatase activity